MREEPGPRLNLELLFLQRSHYLLNVMFTRCMPSVHYGVHMSFACLSYFETVHAILMFAVSEAPPRARPGKRCSSASSHFVV